MEPYIGDIRMFAGTFSPVNYAFCNGQSLPINNNEALYTLIGTTYGGDGVTTFNVPGLQGRIPVHIGQATGGGTINWSLGTAGGTEGVTLTTAQIPAHTHTFMVSTAAPSVTTASNNSIAKGKHYVDSSKNPTMGSLYNQVLQPVGGSQAHNNMMPYLGINFIIALNGVFPTQN
jgi:microcystin-dependent protein